MPIAKRNTFGTEDVHGAQIRRLIRAGDRIPANLTVPPEDIEDDTDVADKEEKQAPKRAKVKKDADVPAE